MSDAILSVGVDLGTSTTQMIVSRLKMENTAAPFTIPRMEITDREILYKSPVHFTPLLSADTLDAQGIEAIVAEEYRRAGIRPQQVETGAVIITGETARKENAKQVLEALSDFAGDFVVATAGPALESVLAARGAGADQYARERRAYVLHMDIGGGTSNLALYGPEGKLLDTGCLNVGGRLMKFDMDGTVTYLSPVLAGICPLEVGDRAAPEELKPVLDQMIRALEEAAGLEPPTDCLTHFITDKTVQLPQEKVILSFSGGVADLIGEEKGDWLRYGDLGVLLGRAIARSKLCHGPHTLGRETIRATVVGAGSYATELSGSTVAYTGVEFPLQNLPVLTLTAKEEAAPPEILARTIGDKLAMYPQDSPVALALTGQSSPPYEEIRRLAEGIAKGLEPVYRMGHPLVVLLEQDMGKALGQALASYLPQPRKLVCLDGLHAPEGSYLDIAAPVGHGTALPVVIKTLAFQ